MSTPNDPHPTLESQDLLDRISAFEQDKEFILEAMRLFGISNAEYERAMRALTFAPTISQASTQTVAPYDPHAILE